MKNIKNKTCVRCRNNKLISNFHINKTENRYNSWCKGCVYKNQIQRWSDRKKKAIELMGGKCCKCGYCKNTAALDFHHIDPSKKEYDWNKLRLRSWDSIIKELKKCLLVCKNCHAELHWPNVECKNNENNSLNSEINPTGKCPNCKEDVFGTKYCSTQCSGFSKRRVKRPNLKDLKDLIENNSYCAIGKMFNVSDTAVRKWAKSYGLI